MTIAEIGKRARVAAAGLAQIDADTKDRALDAMADALIEHAGEILAANEEDLARAKTDGITGALIDRLTLTDKRIEGMAQGLRDLTSLPDPVGEVVSAWSRPNGLQIERVRVPLGVVGIIYEARPNVTVDAAGICLKSGNASILRGSSTAISSNKVLARLIDDAGVAAGLPKNCVQLIEDTARESAKELMRAREYVDVLIPRGGPELIRTTVEESTVPVIETGVGNCHVYVDARADLDKALAITVNAKTQRPGVCNAAETLLVHEDVADRFLPRVADALTEADVELRGDEKSRAIRSSIVPATTEDWDAEYLDLIMAVGVVASLDEAIDRINEHGTNHTDAIVTEDAAAAERFANEVDSACVMVNASTRFADGGEFGFGAEIGISNQKLHARGPMALVEMTSYKYIVRGDGQ
ncbi:MAG TPA: glutamate-5-semialdehyde dehydrogenase, partial [Actinomycetota bacterium]|nr:glutamate-5-semialdehyde dehydrogenase [Actinomycetota bacterium]